MATYLITGCSRGIGLEMVKQLIARPTSAVATVFATSRATTPSQALNTLIKDSNNRAIYVQLDTESRDSISSAVTQVSQHLDKTAGLDILINNAGVQHREPGRAPGMDALEKTLKSNVVAVHDVTSAFLPSLRQGKGKKIVNITSTLGSFGYVQRFAMSPTPSYKISKTALNMLTVQYGMDLKEDGFVVTCISPGWLKTDLGGSYADLEPRVGVEATLRIVDGLTAEDNGRFSDIVVEGHEGYQRGNAPW